MKLLIVDDEKYTREGLLESIDWHKLGIEEVFTADDGISALSVIANEKPEIILSDIRMPRMDGIRLIEQLNAIGLDASVIFMSGYSDKEYLKAAIRLKVLHYVEKPLNLEEVAEAVLKAKREQLQLQTLTRSKNWETLQKEGTLATYLTRPYKENTTEIKSLTKELYPSLQKDTYFTTYVVKVRTEDADGIYVDGFLLRLKTLLKVYNYDLMYVRLHSIYHVFHVFGKRLPSDEMEKEFTSLIQHFYSEYGPNNIVQGETISGIKKVYDAYTALVITLQSSFFFPSGTVLKANSVIRPGDRSVDYDLPAGYIKDFVHALEQVAEPVAIHALEELYSFYKGNLAVLPSHAKDSYYRLVSTISDASNEQGLRFHPETFSIFENAFSFEEIHRRTIDLTLQYFSALSSHTPEETTISLIRGYVAQHYSDDTLSIKDVGEHVSLSISYVCTYFKNQTGETLNQYITNYRMERAKELLRDPRNQISKISEQVGYSNGNYFSKSFKKYTGMTPSGYRENVL
ncbi:response regulator [Ohessyouella blattaphilus]|uniref:Stage 0 sporulation protein A homolog n=1 Tax=Ohessyouella blattaphilus TaxID=2949333 RepID=A0ABT1EI46_9FIRM|nr:response regulator [Ohessyouella blattaphilus]MCP1108977.1 response regulator [Ohessyouella blattaphilus]MCR8562371.1 response regulator [Ohessyouella blattaphilus]